MTKLCNKTATARGIKKKNPENEILNNDRENDYTLKRDGERNYILKEDRKNEYMLKRNRDH
jgi:hypothetical protein